MSITRLPNSHVGDSQVKPVLVRVRDHRPTRCPIAMARLLRLLHEDHLRTVRQLTAKAILGEGLVQGTRLTRSATTKDDLQEERLVQLAATKDPR